MSDSSKDTEQFYRARLSLLSRIRSTLRTRQSRPLAWVPCSRGPCSGHTPAHEARHAQDQRDTHLESLLPSGHALGSWDPRIPLQTALSSLPGTAQASSPRLSSQGHTLPSVHTSPLGGPGVTVCRGIWGRAESGQRWTRRV